MAGLVALALGYVLSHFYRAFMAVLAPALITDLGATKGDLSLASGTWFATFALAQFVVGVCLDRYGPKRTTSAMLALGGVGAFLFAAATAPWAIVCAMALIGVGCAPILMAAIFIFARTSKPAQLAVRTSAMMAIGSLGNVFGTSPLAAASEAFGWRAVLVGMGVVTLAVALAIELVVRDPPREPADTGSGSGFAGYMTLLRIRNLWLIAPLVALGYAPAASVRGLWAGPYLTDVYGADTLLIGNIVFFMALAMVAGAAIYGPLDTLFRTRKWVAIVGNGLAMGVFLVLAVAPAPGITVVTILLMLMGILGGSYGLLMAHGRAFVPLHLTGRGVTLLNFFSIGGTGVVQFATGAVYAAGSTPGVPVSGYQALFWFYALALAAALAVYLLVLDARPERTADAGAGRGGVDGTDSRP